MRVAREPPALRRAGHLPTYLPTHHERITIDKEVTIEGAGGLEGRSAVVLEADDLDVVGITAHGDATVRGMTLRCRARGQGIAAVWMQVRVGGGREPA